MITALREKMKNYSRSDTAVSLLALILIAAITYLPLILQLGFYRDDWHVVWGGTVYGAQKIVDLHAVDRPFMGAAYALAFAVLGSQPLGWHIYAFLLRLAGGLSFYWLVRMLWRKQRLAATAMALLFVVYPGFLQQPNANAYHCHLLGFASGVFSMAASVKALLAARRREKVLFTILAMLSALGCFLIMEYMVGLEGVRLLVLAYILWCGWQGRKEIFSLLRRLFIVWLPYLLVLSGFLFWRIFVFKSARSVTDVGELGKTYAGDPFNMLLRVLVETLKDFIDTVLSGWFVPFYNTLSQARYPELAASLLLAGAAVLLLLLYLRRESRTSFDDASHAANGSGGRLLKHAVWLGVLTSLIALVPAVLANRQVEFNNAFDRYTLPAVIGASMLLGGTLFVYLSPALRNFALCGLLGIAVMTQFNNAVFFRDFWEYQRQLWWQLSWRAPDLKEGTTLVAVLPQDYRLWESYEIWGPANLIYHPYEGDLKIGGEVLNEQTLVPMVLQESFLKSIRRVEYTIDFKNSLIADLPGANSCVHVLDAAQYNVSEYSDPMVRLAAGSSHTSLIETEAQPHIPPQAVFGAEPEHGWCYYYQKASLAYQRQDWEEAARLGDEAARLGLQPSDDSEWMPFYRAYAYLRRFDDANRLGAVLRQNYAFLRMYCQTAASADIAGGADARIEQFMIENICGVE